MEDKITQHWQTRVPPEFAFKMIRWCMIATLTASVAASVWFWTTTPEPTTTISRAAAWCAQLSGLPAPLLFGIMAGLAIASGVPRTIVCALAGALYGTLQGSMVALLSACLASILNYGCGRLLPSSCIQRLLERRIPRLDEMITASPFRFTLYGRLFPFSHTVVFSLLCGWLRIPVSIFGVASFIGFVPLTLLIASLGNGFAVKNILQILITALLLTVMLLRRRRTAEPDIAKTG